MPKKPTDFSKTIIYKLCCNDVAITEIYIGSTTNFSQRKKSHKKNCNAETGKEYNMYKYKFIRDNGGFENWSMIQLEAYPCETKREAEARERYWFELLKPKLNSIIPFRTEQEIVEYAKQYHEANKEQLLEKQKQYREANKEKQKQYCQANKEHIREQKKQYYLNKKQQNNSI